jgi:hypothetical protein
MTTTIKAKYVPGWNGGHFETNKGLRLSQAELPNNVLVRLGRNPKTAVASPVARRGVDNDHGHEYSWVALDFELTLQTQFGPVSKSLYELLQERKLTTFTLVIES